MSSQVASVSSDKGETIDIIERLLMKLDIALDAVAKAKAFAKSTYQTDVFQIAETMMASDEGMEALYSRAPLFDEVGAFAGGPWVDAAKLQPPLVTGSLQAAGVYPVVETMSELRMLAIAKGRCASEVVSAEEAEQFLDEVMALNLAYLFPRDTEEERIEGGPHRDHNIRLFRLLARELALTSLRRDVVSEIEQICAQRPISTERVREMVEMAARIPRDHDDPESDEKIAVYTSAVKGPGALSGAHPDVADYRTALASCDAAALEAETDACAAAMMATGLVAPHHAVLLRHLRAKEPDLLARALRLNEVGAAELSSNRELAHQLIKVAIRPATTQSIYGFARVLERGLLSRKEIVAGLQRIVEIDLQSDVRRKLLARRDKRDGVTANALLLAGLIAVLGQPLGIGQGRNPTCQAARALSLWAQYAPAYLVEVLVSAARDGHIEVPFEGTTIRSDLVVGGLARRLDLDLDPVSLVLVPHLDRIYDEMMTRVAGRQMDGHKWVNPAMYGHRWVPSGFASVFADVAQTTVADFEDFVRGFYATHHPAFNDGHTLTYPNPIGLCVTNSHGDHLGPHAILLQRVAEDPTGELRAYFFNPNNEGRQDWGHGVRPSIRGFGEEEGESSLLFHQFASRIYAFHYNPYEEGDGYAVPNDVVREIEAAARKSWGKTFLWID